MPALVTDEHLIEKHNLILEAEKYRAALARALARSEKDVGIVSEPMIAAIAHASRVANLETENERLRDALFYVLEDEENGLPRASSTTRDEVRRALTE